MSEGKAAASSAPWTGAEALWKARDLESLVIPACADAAALGEYEYLRDTKGTDLKPMLKHHLRADVSCSAGDVLLQAWEHPQHGLSIYLPKFGYGSRRPDRRDNVGELWPSVEPRQRVPDQRPLAFRLAVLEVRARQEIERLREMREAAGVPRDAARREANERAEGLCIPVVCDDMTSAVLVSDLLAHVGEHAPKLALVRSRGGQSHDTPTTFISGAPGYGLLVLA
jgi:hypothetical protein